jgi:hypothetical protein
MSLFTYNLYLPALIHGTRTCAQLHSDTGRTLVPHSAASGRETGLESLLRARVSIGLYTVCRCSWR